MKHIGKCFFAPLPHITILPPLNPIHEIVLANRFQWCSLLSLDITNHFHLGQCLSPQLDTTKYQPSPPLLPPPQTLTPPSPLLQPHPVSSLSCIQPADRTPRIHSRQVRSSRSSTRWSTRSSRWGMSIARNFCKK